MPNNNPKVYILHENNEWTNHLVKWLEAKKIPYELWNLADGILDLQNTPPLGIFYNRLSASAHTRHHRFAPEFGQQVIEWLEAHHRVVLNGSNAIDLEISKVKQYLALQQSNIQIPKTAAVLGKHNLVAAAKQLDVFPLITKHNRAGKGAGVHRFDSLDELSTYMNSDEFEEPVDGITLLQQYIKPIDGHIRRSEFINQQFLYTVSIDSSDGFELCPADECQIPDPTTSKFKIIAPLADTQKNSYEKFLIQNNINIAAIEWVEDAQHHKYVYDINTNTNYNAQAEQQAGIFAHEHLATYLGETLTKQYGISIK